MQELGISESKLACQLVPSNCDAVGGRFQIFNFKRRVTAEQAMLFDQAASFLSTVLPAQHKMPSLESLT